jgi:hypothetical protein
MLLQHFIIVNSQRSSIFSIKYYLSKWHKMISMLFDGVHDFRVWKHRLYFFR